MTHTKKTLPKSSKEKISSNMLVDAYDNYVVRAD